MGGTASAGAAGFSFGGGVDQLGGAGGAPTASAGSPGLPATGGAPATGGSANVAGASTATGGSPGTVSEPANNDQSSGCSIGTRSSDARPLLAGLLGLFLLGRRRRRSRASS
jgi:MYXO-CTERM domain-containing protein